MADDPLIPEGIRDDRSLSMAAVYERLQEIDITAALVYLFDHVDATALPHLVWQYDLYEYVDETTPEEVIRRLLKVAIELRRYHGTRWAVRAALEAAGADPEIIEWWETDPQGPVDTFEVTAFRTDAPFDKATLERLDRFIEVAKRFSQDHSFKAGLRQEAGLSLGLMTQPSQRLFASVEPGADMTPECRIVAVFAPHQIHQITMEAS